MVHVRDVSHPGLPRRPIGREPLHPDDVRRSRFEDELLGELHWVARSQQTPWWLLHATPESDLMLDRPCPRPCLTLPVLPGGDDCPEATSIMPSAGHALEHLAELPHHRSARRGS